MQNIKIIKSSKTSNEDLVDQQIFQYIQKMNLIKSGKATIPKPGNLRISTISTKCRLSAELNLQEFVKIFYQKVHENIMLQKHPDYFIQGIQYGPEVIGLFKKMKKKLEKIQNKIDIDDKKNIDFYNQCTLLLYSDYNNNQINFKLFRNGSVTMTGCKDENDGIYVTKKLIQEMVQYREVFNYDEDQHDLAMSNFAITMINSDYYVGFRIDLIKLESVLKDRYEIFSSYDPEVYAAVKVSYMWNNDNHRMDGLCYCPKKCIVDKKKSVKAKNNCSIITVAIFNSGKIIITGSNDFNKTKVVYNFINKILKDNYADVVRFSVHDYNISNKDKKKTGRKGRPKKQVA